MAGIADTNVIDLVAQDADGAYMLVMVEDRPWGADPDQTAQLREKFNTYANYILDGSLAEHFPQTAGEPILIRLDACQPPPEEIAALIEYTTEALDRLGVGLSLNVVDYL